MPGIQLLVTAQTFASGVIGPRDMLSANGQFLQAVAGGASENWASFRYEIVGEAARIKTPFGPDIDVDHRLEDAAGADVVYVPPLAIPPGNRPASSPALLAWLRKQYDDGALICSACTGSLLLAESGVLDGYTATTHWAYAEAFRTLYPNVRLEANRNLVVDGERQQIATAGAHSSWHDLVLYLIHRFGGANAARQVAKVFLIDWHDISQNAYAAFRENFHHGDEVVLSAQHWLAENLSDRSPIESVIGMSRLPQRSFLRRFRSATGHTPIVYVQKLRMEKAKSLLEETDLSIEAIGWRVGYDDTAYFRRLFRKTTDMTPARYRNSFRTPPDVARLLRRN